jgi:hypothetical protein
MSQNHESITGMCVGAVNDDQQNELLIAETEQQESNDKDNGVNFINYYNVGDQGISRIKSINIKNEMKESCPFLMNVKYPLLCCITNSTKDKLIMAIGHSLYIINKDDSIRKASTDLDENNMIDNIFYGQFDVKRKSTLLNTTRRVEQGKTNNRPTYKYINEISMIDVGISN